MVLRTQHDPVKDDLVANNIDGTTASTIEKTAFGSGFWKLLITERGLTTGEPETSFFEQGFTFPEVKIRGRRRLNYENLFYPEDIVSSKQDR